MMFEGLDESNEGSWEMQPRLKSGSEVMRLLANRLEQDRICGKAANICTTHVAAALEDAQHGAVSEYITS